MATPRRIEWLGTYFVPGNERKEEITRLAIEDEIFTTGTGGPLSEQSEARALRRVLDIACGTGGWAIEVAAKYPGTTVVGIDVGRDMVEVARAQASARKSKRVTFQVMDALKPLEFAAGSFDLVNLRLGSTFLRTWDWSAMLAEMMRVLRSGGIVRLTEAELTQESSSKAHARCFELLLSAEFNAGHLFEQKSNGLTAYLPRLLGNHGWQNVQSKVDTLIFETGTPGGDLYYDYFQHARTILPFVQKWGNLPQDGEIIYNQALIDIQQPGFRASWNVHTVWGSKR